MKKLQNRLRTVQKRIVNRFDEVREAHNHSGSKGSNVEQIVRDFLREYLPPNYRIGEGEIIDASGEISSQIDVIVTNDYQPYWNDLKQPGIFIIEGIAAAGEIKSVLNGDELTTTLEKCASVQALNSTKSESDTVFGTQESISRWVENRPYFLFAFESKLTLNTVYQKIVQYNHEHQVPFPEQIDAVFMLDRGTLVNHGKKSGLIARLDGSEENHEGYVHWSMEKNPPVEMLLTWLSASILNVKSHNAPILHYLTNSD